MRKLAENAKTKRDRFDEIIAHRREKRLPSKSVNEIANIAEVQWCCIPQRPGKRDKNIS